MSYMVPYFAHKLGILWRRIGVFVSILFNVAYICNFNEFIQ